MTPEQRNSLGYRFKTEETEGFLSKTLPNHFIIAILTVPSQNGAPVRIEISDSLGLIDKKKMVAQVLMGNGPYPLDDGLLTTVLLALENELSVRRTPTNKGGD